MKDLMKQVAEMVNAQLALVNIELDNRTIYGINFITIQDDKLVCDTISSQTHIITIDYIRSFNYVVTQ